MRKWQEEGYPARLQDDLGDGVVQCRLSPRNCRIRPGQHGFCMVRANRDGTLVSLNYGRSVHATEETIETEAVFHFEPGARILSMGNIGCMLNCDYCHNWKTSQARFVADSDVFYYTPAEVVDIAVRHGIKVISWTYNDPVVWHEFVTETAALARQKGIVNLYKSAFFISEKAVEELIPVIDIFSVSIKSMDAKYYRKITKGWIEPVLAATEQVYRSGRHLEVSTLMVTDLSDGEDTARDMARFVGERLGPEVPTHFVRFHPDYKMTNTIRTPVDRLERARQVALDMGLEHVYLGNVYDTEAANTWCRACGALQITRYGLNARLLGLTPEGACARCGTDARIRRIPGPAPARPVVADLPTSEPHDVAGFDWEGDVRAVHIRVRNDAETPRSVYHRRRRSGGAPAEWVRIDLRAGESYRFIAAQSLSDEIGVVVAVPPGCVSSLHQVFDRAHFPTTEAEAGTVNADVTPLPLYVRPTR
ncbi:AmmeMemoRadiSam system radical SAM enzyme [Actinoalloteichus hoggarensis]|uniref:Benzylsuccinate synthase activating enzyme n=2 Tax=Actinoalloteichus hoggarensis TaxID=1470176 RepID=A0A221W1W9_9PSEU|nr:AmmeMemoRadiSam system radical SAM enzyme [Actinoalloteichus hoggarensis]ASO19581.1 Benzylsuccinate synthase activating enzyme [Actinoalloteichus hoggarensis]